MVQIQVRSFVSKAGTTDFDMGYFYNIEEAAPGYYISGWEYIGNGSGTGIYEQYIREKANGRLLKD
ncbi:MAG: DUF4374 domain-containing protein [Taibaiella sp.]|nr:DUF4374 domain-containing protein [Taibaiella sp.]